MGCLSVSASRIGNGVACDAFRLGEGIHVNVHKISKPILCKAEILNERLNISVSRLGDRLNVSASLICTVNKSAFLSVVPDVLWLSPDMLASADFDIISNVEWIIN